MRQIRKITNYGIRSVLVTIAVLYFLIDAIFLSLVRPINRLLMALPSVRRLQRWIDDTNRYAALALFIVPLIVLEPVKPIGFYLMAHKLYTEGLIVIVVGELIKLTLFERLFHMTKPKLMSFPWFAAGYARWQAAVAYLRSLRAWQTIIRWYRALRMRVFRQRWFFG